MGKKDLNGWISKDASIDQINLTLEQAWDQKSQWPYFAKNSFAIFKEKFPVAAIPVFLNQLNYSL